jgi:putative hydrolase of the HAD superfamily
VKQADVAAVLFDAVGTLIELRETVGITYARVAVTHGVELPEWRLADAFARVLAGSTPMVFPDAATPRGAVSKDRSRVHELERAWWHGVVRATFQATDSTARFTDFEAFFDALWRHYAGADCWRRREPVEPLLADLAAQGLSLGIASNFDHRLPEVLEAVEIGRFFGCITLPSEVGSAKPAPQLLAAACSALAVEPAATLYVGDSDGDAQAARAAGLLYFDVRKPASAAALRAPLAALATLGRSQLQSDHNAPGDRPSGTVEGGIR